MPAKKWNSTETKHSEYLSNLVLETNSQALSHYQRDFGGMSNGEAVALCQPETEQQVQTLLSYAYKNQLSVTVRCLGLSQSGQSLACKEGLILDLSRLNTILDINPTKQTMHVQCGALWRDIALKSLEYGLIPKVLPYNLDISLGGILSVGGLGAASFKQGIIAAHVIAMRVATADGKIVECNKQQHCELFDACLSGMGQFAVILSATIDLRPAKTHVTTYYLSYNNVQSWLNDLNSVRNREDVDYLESFASPCIQGLKNNSYGRREPFAQWLYCMHLSCEHDRQATPYERLINGLGNHRCVLQEKLTINEYISRHDERFRMMRRQGQWQLHHPWYECYVPHDVLQKHIDEIFNKISLTLGGVYHIFPIGKKNKPKYFMMPKQDNIFTFNILTPGVSDDVLKVCRSSLEYIDNLFQSYNGKRYISGWLGENPNNDFWQRHYGLDLHNERMLLKKKYDKKNIFCSKLCHAIHKHNY